MTNWDLNKIKDGFDHFQRLHGRLPKAAEIDTLPYLPSSRWIQLEFGGLEKVRTTLGYVDTHFGKGEFRSKIATSVNKTGRAAEMELEHVLQDKFGEIAVHTEKVYEGKMRVDFYIYFKTGQFGIDVFHSQTLKTLQSNVNIKILKYKSFTKLLFLVSANTQITQSQIDAFIKNRKLQLPPNVHVVTTSKLLQEIEKFKSL